MAERSIVIIGAGVVGAALADELTQRGAGDVTVVDKGRLFATGGSSTHAPGLVSRTSPSRFMQETADHTISKLASLSTPDAPALVPVGTLEVAYTAERLRELWRRHDVARSWGWRGRMIDPDEALSLWPILRPGGLLGAYTTTGEGLAVALRAVEAQARRAEANGATFRGGVEVTGIATRTGRVTGVATTDGEIPADVVVCCAGVWGPVVAGMVGLRLPMLAMEHQYAITSPIPALRANAGAWATMPILRHHDIGIYYRDHGDRVGIGSFHHRGLPVPADGLDSHPRNLTGLDFAFTEEDWTEAWDLTVDALPALAGASLETRFNGVFGFTPDGYPLIGEHPDLAGFWVAESVWVTHSAGVARVVAETLLEGGAWIDASPADLTRFDETELDPAVYEARCDDQYRDVYVAHHPVEPHTSARGLRWSPFAERERALGAVFFDVATWERPQWYEANEPLVVGVRIPPRDDWSAAHWSPISIAEHLAVRERAGLFDMTPLMRIEVTGPGADAFLRWIVAGREDRPVGSVLYSVMLDARGGIRSDVTVARLDEGRFVVGVNGPRDHAWLRGLAPRDGSVQIRRVTDHATAGLWGPAAPAILGAVSDTDPAELSYLSARRISVAGIDADAVGISYAGERGWELTAAGTDGEALWDALWDAGRPVGLVAAGRAALGTLRLEKGYRAWGVDMTTEHAPAEAGLGFTVRAGGEGFLGREGLGARPPAPRTLRCLLIEDDQVALGGEPVLIGDEAVGFVTSAGYGPSVGRSIAYAWLPSALAAGDRVEIGYLGRILPAAVSDDPPFDPDGARLRAPGAASRRRT
jgi:glycine cleavage system aminomethyltransferase T/glycine/D-amino acid oxidase-like deaminating enzyme